MKKKISVIYPIIEVDESFIDIIGLADHLGHGLVKQIVKKLRRNRLDNF